MRSNSKLFALLIGLLLGQSVDGATWEITFPRIVSDDGVVDEYPAALLKLALEQTGVNYELKPSEQLLTADKAMRQLIVNRDIDIAWSATDEDKENDFLPIRVPIYKGLTGWRLFLIAPNSAAKFAKVNDLEDLLKYTATQRLNSPSATVLQAKQFNVVTGGQTENMFAQLADGQADFLARSVIDVRKDFDLWSQHQPVIIEKRLGLRYPAAMYFFLNTRNVTLHRLIETGLNKAIENGEFDALFQAYHGEMLSEFDLNKRQFFDLENPTLPTDTPTDNSQLWFSIEEEL